MTKELIEWRDFKDEQPQDGRGVYVKNVQYATIFTGYMRNGTLISGDITFEDYELLRGYMWAYRSKAEHAQADKDKGQLINWNPCTICYKRPAKGTYALIYRTNSSSFGGYCVPDFKIGKFNEFGTFYVEGTNCSVALSDNELANKGYYWVPMQDLIPKEEIARLFDWLRERQYE